MKEISELFHPNQFAKKLQADCWNYIAGQDLGILNQRNALTLPYHQWQAWKYLRNLDHYNMTTWVAPSVKEMSFKSKTAKIKIGDKRYPFDFEEFLKTCTEEKKGLLWGNDSETTIERDQFTLVYYSQYVFVFDLRTNVSTCYLGDRQKDGMLDKKKCAEKLNLKTTEFEYFVQYYYGRVMHIFIPPQPTTGIKEK